MRSYVKPELFFESYEVNQNIAACRWDLNHANKQTCTAEYDSSMHNEPLGDPDAILFLDQNKNCTMNEDTAEGSFDYCYFTGADTAKLFQS